MAWLYLPPDALTHARTGGACSDFPSAPEPEASTSDSTLPTPDIELWVTSSGTPTLRPRSWRGWKTRPWIARLSGTTLPTSMADLGAAWWISSMAAIRASRSVSPESSSATKTRATSGLTSPASCARSNRQSVSSKTSPDIYDLALSKSTMTFDGWVTALRQGCLRRKKLVLRTNASGSSFWLTPRAQESSEKQETFLARNGDRTDRCAGSLTAQSALWPTPRAREPGSTSSDHGISLNEVSKSWPTPRPCSGKRSSGGNRTEIVKTWSTPTARDWKDGVLINNKTATGSNLSRQAPRTKLGGSGCSSAPRTLNPLFVEALMGWPIGWTDCGSAVTGLSRWSRLMRSKLSRLLQAPTDEQLDLFA